MRLELFVWDHLLPYILRSILEVLFYKVAMSLIVHLSDQWVLGALLCLAFPEY